MGRLPEPRLRPFCTLMVEVGPSKPFGQGRFGQRRMVPILGGTVSGPYFAGKVLGDGADWQTVNPEGLTELSAHYAFETDDGAIIEIVNSGLRHALPDILVRLSGENDVPPGSSYMRTTALLQTGHPGYQWLNGLLFVGTGAKVGDTVQIDLYAVE